MQDGVLPMWVADMDFGTLPVVTQTLENNMSHSFFGYSEVKDRYFNAVRTWFKTRFEFEAEVKWIVRTPGVLFALAMAICAYTEKGDSVMIQPPVYHQFKNLIQKNNRKLVINPLVYNNGKYYIDFVDFEEKIRENNVKLFIFCSPHNPVGRVWTKDEIICLGKICLKYNCIVFSDEINCDVVLYKKSHVVFSTAYESLKNISIIATSPSKAFNLAGLQVANIFVPDDVLRAKIKLEIAKAGVVRPNILGLLACQSVYEDGTDWMVSLIEYLNKNVELVDSFISKKMPKIRLIKPEATYLIWLDFSALRLPQETLNFLVTNVAKVWLLDGALFGEQGIGFMRMNIACPRKTLKNALVRLSDVIPK